MSSQRGMLHVVLWVLLICVDWASAETQRRGQFELGIGIKYVQPAGDFDNAADALVGGSGQIGYWVTDRLTVGGNYDSSVFMPPDFWENINAYAGYDEIGWSVGELGAYVQYDVLRFIKHMGSLDRTTSVYLGARTGRFSSTFTAKAGDQEFKATDVRAGYVGSLGVRLWADMLEENSMFRGLSVWAELDYATISYFEENIQYVALEVGLSGHFGMGR